MKKTSLVLALAAISFASSGAFAQAYVSADVGKSKLGIKCAGAKSCDDSDTAYRITGGYTFYEGLSAEIGYEGFGTAKSVGPTGTHTLKASGPTVGLAYRLPMGDAWGLDFRAGVAHLKAESTVRPVTGPAVHHSGTSNSPYFGIGADYALSKNMKLQAGFEATRAEVAGTKSNLKAFTLGVRYDF